MPKKPVPPVTNTLSVIVEDLHQFLPTLNPEPWFMARELTKKILTVILLKQKTKKRMAACNPFLGF